MTKPLDLNLDLNTFVRVTNLKGESLIGQVILIRNFHAGIDTRHMCKTLLRVKKNTFSDVKMFPLNQHDVGDFIVGGVDSVSHNYTNLKSDMGLWLTDEIVCVEILPNSENDFDSIIQNINKELNYEL